MDHGRARCSLWTGTTTSMRPRAGEACGVARSGTGSRKAGGMAAGSARPVSAGWGEPVHSLSPAGYCGRDTSTTTGRRVRMASEETGQVTGTKDKDYNIIWFTEQCLSNVLRLETYAQDAEREGDNELAEFFRRAQGESRKGAEQGKAMLASRISG